MALSSHNILLLGSILLFVSIITSKTSFKFGIPALILFLIVGMVAGSDGLGGIYFNDPKIAEFLGVVALTFILFSGGLDTKWDSVKPVLKSGISLSTIGVVVTASIVGICSAYLLNMTILEGLLLGAIVSSTDAAAVFSILRSRNIGLKGVIRPLLELESGSNDPMAYFLTVSFTFLVQNPDVSILSLIPKFIIGMVLGTVCGYTFGKLMIFITNKIRLDIEGLYPVLILSLVFFTFSFTNFIGGNGFLAIYIAAIILGNANFIHKKSLMKFYDGQAWLMQIIMFLTLGLLVFPSQIVPFIGPGVLLAGVLMFLARPVAVFIALANSALRWRKKLFISWVGLRGAVPIVFAIYPLTSGVQNASMIFNLVFFISVSSVLVQGTTLALVARWLKVSVPEKLKRKFPLDIEIKDDIKAELLELDIPSRSPIAGKAVVDLNLPRTALIVLIHRDGKYMTVRGDTVIQEHDHLLIMADNKDAVKDIHASFHVDV